MANFTVSDYLKAAEIMAVCNPKNIDLVVHFLKKAGICDDDFLMLINAYDYQKPETRGRKRVVDPEFVALLNKAREDNVLFLTLSETFKIQKSRLNEWADGERGIASENKTKITKFINDWFAAQNDPKFLNALSKLRVQSDENGAAEEPIP